ncbi:Glyoxalase/bleomycin resistance protein/dioxygenase [Acidovorax delafieldii 2AN]|uniref:Bleomycin resistance protein n=1 Tax=Acidovorax delafieldii 2AN TaxID=573060 RepID=C5T6W3_ACIDE|nr:Glyoxalase/bleomycin resistance protein/dioxygenase [Acidovorax delafieldii 2AN]
MSVRAVARIHATVPVLASLDLSETEAFYRERLGFACALRANGYLIVARDGCELHFWPCAERHIAENTSCYVRGDTRALHAEFTARGLSLTPPEERAWGMRELYVIDPHGNLLKFGEPL